jgi:hypothetical protein
MREAPAGYIIETIGSLPITDSSFPQYGSRARESGHYSKWHWRHVESGRTYQNGIGWCYDAEEATEDAWRDAERSIREAVRG